MKTIKDILNQYRETYASPKTIDDAKILKDIKSNYDNIVDLLARIKNSIDEDNYDIDTTLYEDDCDVLSHTLDIMKLLIDEIDETTFFAV